MTSLLKVTTRWSGFTGSPGYSNFYFRDFTSGEPTDVDADAAADRLDTFWVAVKGLFPAASVTGAPKASSMTIIRILRRRHG